MDPITAIDHVLDELEGKGARRRPLSTVNWDGSECKSVAELSAANRASELVAAAYAIEHPDEVMPELLADAEVAITGSARDMKIPPRMAEKDVFSGSGAGGVPKRRTARRCKEIIERVGAVPLRKSAP